jgi:hypothetical protein
MGRAQKNVRRAKGAGTGTQRQPTALANGKGNGVRKATGTERPEPVTHNPADMADTQARVIKTRS